MTTYTIYPEYVLRDDGAVIPKDAENADYAAFLAWQADGNTPAEPAGPTQEERTATLLRSVDALLNAAANARGYDGILSAALRAALPDSPFHDEGVAFGTWMDAVYAKCYEVQDAVLAGQIPEPTLPELVAMLPALELP